jgi:hypothetical protein
MHSITTVIVGPQDLNDEAVYLHDEDGDGHRLTAVRLGNTTIQTQPDEVSPLDLAALFDRWAQEIRERLGVLHPLVETPDFTPSGGAA